MLRVTRNLLIRRGTRIVNLRYKPYTNQDIENDEGKSLGPMHLGRLKGLDVEKLEDFDDEISKSSSHYCLNRETPVSKQLGLVSDEESIDDKLYSHIDLELSAHDNKIINSYIKLMIFCCKKLNVEWERMQIKPNFSRRIVLRGPFVHKRFRSEFEIRNYTQVLRLNYLTGSSYKALVGFFQHNIPYGVVMKVHKYELLEAPSAIKTKKLTSDQIDDVTKFRLREIDFEPYVTSRHYFFTTFNNQKPPHVSKGPFWDDVMDGWEKIDEEHLR